MEIQLLNWKIAEVYALPIRIEVFVQEQNVPIDLEQDQYDSIALHAVLFVSGKAVGTARLFQESPVSNIFCIGRVCVLQNLRGQGYGYKMMEALIAQAKKMGSVECQIHAQLTSQSFYSKLGFVASSETFMEAGIEHVMMRLAMPQ
jgi:predicted GNAT family N-acyltransferase